MCQEVVLLVIMTTIDWISMWWQASGRDYDEDKDVHEDAAFHLGQLRNKKNDEFDDAKACWWKCLLARRWDHSEN